MMGRSAQDRFPKQFTQDILIRSKSSVAFMIRKQIRDAAQEGGGTGGERGIKRRRIALEPSTALSDASN